VVFCRGDHFSYFVVWAFVPLRGVFLPIIVVDFFVVDHGGNHYRKFLSLVENRSRKFKDLVNKFKNCKAKGVHYEHWLITEGEKVKLHLESFCDELRWLVQSPIVMPNLKWLHEGMPRTSAPGRRVGIRVMVGTSHFSVGRGLAAHKIDSTFGPNWFVSSQPHATSQQSSQHHGRGIVRDQGR
jgi:hypothetical protein